MLKKIVILICFITLSFIVTVQESHAQLIKPKKPEDCDILFVTQRNRLFPEAKFKVTKKCTIALYKFSFPDTIKERYKSLDLGSLNLFQTKISNFIVSSNYFDVVARKEEDIKEVLTVEQNLWSNPTSFQTTAATNFGKMYGADLGIIFEINTIHFDHSVTRIRNAEFEEKVTGKISVGFKTINLITGKIVCENSIQTKNENKKIIMFANNNIDYQQAFEDLLDKTADQFSENFIKCTNYKDFMREEKNTNDFEKPLIDVMQIVANSQAGADINYIAALKNGADNKLSKNDILDLIYKNSIVESTIGKCIIIAINSEAIQAKLTTVLETLSIENKTENMTPYYCRRTK